MTPRPLPVVAPPADGLAGAFREARRRRQRSAAASGSAGVMAALVLLSAVADGGSTRLVQEPVDPATQTRIVLGPDRPDPRVPVSPVLTGPPATAPALQQPVAPDGGSAQQQDGRAVPKHAASAKAPAGGGSGAGPASGSVTRDKNGGTYFPDDIDCVARTGQPLCSSVTLGSTGSARHELVMYTCNKSTESVTLRFSRAEEARFEVRQMGEVLFRTSAPAVHDDHAVVVEPTWCLRWTTTWSGRWPDGSRVEGNVRATGLLLSDSAGAAREATYDYRPASYGS